MYKHSRQALLQDAGQLPAASPTHAPRRTLQVARAVVQHVSVDLAHRNDDHEGVAPGLGVEDGIDEQRAEGAPQEGGDGLGQAVQSATRGRLVGCARMSTCGSTVCSNRFHFLLTDCPIARRLLSTLPQPRPPPPAARTSMEMMNESRLA